MSNPIINDLLSIQAVFLRPDQPFTWASGIKSPIYCDNRLTLSYPDVRKRIAQGLAEIIKMHYADVNIIMGTATAGIAHAAFVSEILDLPMGYVRASTKDHGRNNKIEGKYQKGDKVVVIEDLISTGESSLNVVRTLKASGLDVLGVIAIFSYQFPQAKINFETEKIPHHVLATFEDLVKTAVELNYITKDSLESLLKWSKNPNSDVWFLK